MATENDRATLHRLGYAQQLRRALSGFSNFAVSFSIISILTGAVILYDYGLAWGGPAANGLGWPLVSVFTLAIAAGLAEIASAYPTAGGPYDWALRLGGARWGWWTAWLNLGGQVAVIAGIDFAAAGFLCSAVLEPLGGPAGDTLVAGLSLQVWLTGALIGVQTLLNNRGVRLTGLLSDVSVWVHLLGVLAIVVALLTLGPLVHPPAYAFEVRPANPDPGVPLVAALLLSLLQAQWTFTGYDASGHLSEETRRARRASAWGLFLSVAVSAVVGYLLLLAITLRLPPVEDVLAHPPAVYYTLIANLGALGGALGAWIALAMVLCGTAAVAPAGRLLWAFARDAGLPGAPWLVALSPTRTPARASSVLALAAWLLVAVAFLVGGVAAIAVVTAISTICLYLAYAAPLYLGVTGPAAWRADVVWSLGRYSRPLVTLALMWIAVICLLFVWPTSANPGTWYMLLIYVVALALFDRLWARGHFHAPRRLTVDEATALDSPAARPSVER